MVYDLSYWLPLVVNNNSWLLLTYASLWPGVLWLWEVHPRWWYGSIPILDRHGFLRGQPQLKRSSEPYYSYAITHDITINLLGKEVRDPETLWMAQRNSGRNAQGARGDGRNIKKHNNQPVVEDTTMHLSRQGGGWGSRGSRRWRRRMGETNGTAARTTKRRRRPRGPSSPFPRKKRRSLGDDMMDPDPEGEVGGDRWECRGRRDRWCDQRREDERRTVHCPLFPRRRKRRSPALVSSSTVYLGADVGSGSISVCTNN